MRMLVVNSVCQTVSGDTPLAEVFTGLCWEDLHASFSIWAAAAAEGSWPVQGDDNLLCFMQKIVYSNTVDLSLEPYNPETFTRPRWPRFQVLCGLLSNHDAHVFYMQILHTWVHVDQTLLFCVFWHFGISLYLCGSWMVQLVQVFHSECPGVGWLFSFSWPTLIIPLQPADVP